MGRVPETGMIVPLTDGNTLTAKDYEEVLADHRRLVREMDEALSGTGNAAKQASLCDLIPQAKAMRSALEQFAKADLNENNCASLEVATRRIRALAKRALEGKL
jgi:hypothetical protein